VSAEILDKTDYRYIMQQILKNEYIILRVNK